MGINKIINKMKELIMIYKVYQKKYFLIFEMDKINRINKKKFYCIKYKISY